MIQPSHLEFADRLCQSVAQPIGATLHFQSVGLIGCTTDQSLTRLHGEERDFAARLCRSVAQPIGTSLLFRSVMSIGCTTDRNPSTLCPYKAVHIELKKTGGTGEPEESRMLRKGTSIQVPIVLIERLSAQDRVKAEEFINKLIIRHDELEDEKKEIRKKRRELEKRRLDIARELHRLEAHLSDWIELGLQEYGNMPGCIMSIVDLADQGAELFRNSRPF
ncbi:hypothetical protein ISN44_As11g028570 [Arabidopsis suecica]|uniref:Uncharacterized protein n=1 Tax=Arabidopsis suecica TaxID=45249 RepID=A0A8T1ZFH0_ARASU|nr:hypothetical protein ISN44_As11g028570 [Arabidopsis suecica]